MIVVCLADNFYILSSSVSGLQAAGIIIIIGHYALRWHLKFDTPKIRDLIAGSRIYMAYYKDIQPIYTYSENLTVHDTYDHLWLMVSETDEEQKNAVSNFLKCHNELFIYVRLHLRWSIMKCFISSHSISNQFHSMIQSDIYTFVKPALLYDNLRHHTFMITYLYDTFVMW